MTTASLSASAYRERMLGFQRDGRSYQFLALVDAYLEAVPDDHQVRLLAMREYLGLGLVAAAGSLLEIDPAVAVLPAELTSLGDAISAIPFESHGWDENKPVFERNLSVIAGRRLDVQSIRQSWDTAKRRYRLLRDKHGVFQVRRQEKDGRWRWYPYLGNHRAVDGARALPEGIGTSNMPGPFLFDGLGMGWFFERVYRATRDTFLGYSCALFIVERQADLLAIVLHLNDWSELLADPRVFVYCGPNALDALRRTWESDPDLPLPCQVISTGAPASDTRTLDAVRETAALREEQIRRSLDDLNSRYGERDIAYWSGRLDAALNGKGAPLRILSAVSTHTTFLQHSMRDAKRALEAMGHQCVLLTEASNHATTGPLTFHNAIRELDPDLFFVLDHIRPEFEGVIPRNLPVLTWDQDQLPHVLTKANLDRIARHDFMVGCSKSHCVSHGCNPRQFLHARVPTCPEQFGGKPLTEQERARYACDVSYVSHASQTPREFHEQERGGYKDATLVRLLDTLYELLPEVLVRHRVVDGGVMSAVLGEGCRRVGITRLDADLEERLRSWYLWRLGDRLFRHEALEWAGRWARRTGRALRIYGRGWDRHPTLAEFAAGPAENGRELLCVYRASTINLQLMPAGFIHQRSLDGLAAGGFFLARLCPHDLRGSTLRELNARIHALGIDSTERLLACDDAELQRLLATYMGGWLNKMDHRRYDLLTNIRLNAEVPYPDEAFADFREIVFDNEQEFEQRAKRFLGDAPARSSVSAQMRQVVVDRFSYRASMDQFLRAMARYLRETVSESRTR